MKQKLFTVVLLIFFGYLSFHETISAGTVDGSCLEEWELLNFQPESPTYQQLVKSSSYHDRTTVVMLLASG